MAICEQHLPHVAATGDVVVLDGDGSRWVREWSCPSWAEGVPAPVDADGVPVPLGVRELYADDLGRVHVASVAFSGSCWFARFLGGAGVRRLDELHLNRRDSWKRIEEDAGLDPEDYCRLRSIVPDGDTTYQSAMMTDMMARAKVLGGAE